MIALDLTPAEEAQINRLASEIGLPPAEYARRLVQQHLPRWDTATNPPLDEENALAIAQLQAWLREEASSDPKEVRAAAADLDDLRENLNRNRLESGESPLFS